MYRTLAFVHIEYLYMIHGQHYTTYGIRDNTADWCLKSIQSWPTPMPMHDHRPSHAWPPMIWLPGYPMPVHATPHIVRWVCAYQYPSIHMCVRIQIHERVQSDGIDHIFYHYSTNHICIVIYTFLFCKSCCCTTVHNNDATDVNSR